jgi:hypothetical protein
MAIDGGKPKRNPNTLTIEGRADTDEAKDATVAQTMLHPAVQGALRRCTTPSYQAATAFSFRSASYALMLVVSRGRRSNPSESIRSSELLGGGLRRGALSPPAIASSGNSSNDRLCAEGSTHS